MRRAAAILGLTAALCAALSLLTDVSRTDAAPKRRTGASAKAKAPAADSTQVLVRIGRETITRGDVQKRVESLPEQFRATYATPEGRQQLLDRMVEERVWLALAVKNGVADRPQVREQLDRQRQDLIVRTYLNEVMAANPAPSDSEALAYYEAHLDDYKVPATVSVRHVQTKTEGTARKVLKWAERGYDWSKLVEQYSADTLTRKSAGSLGTVTPDGVFASLGSQPALAESAFALPEGGVGGPYRTSRGWHVLKIDSAKPESVRPFDQVRQLITRQLGSQRSQEYYRARLEEARRALGVRADSAAIKNFTSQKRTARELFDEAQAITAPEARIEAYRKLLQEYPNSEVSPQAQFMVGFIYSEELKDYDQAERAFRELLDRYPEAELAPSARWMLEHMRSEDTPPFISLDEDSTAQPAVTTDQNPRGGAGKP